MGALLLTWFGRCGIVMLSRFLVHGAARLRRDAHGARD
jgi:hypothetical protein